MVCSIESVIVSAYIITRPFTFLAARPMVTVEAGGTLIANGEITAKITLKDGAVVKPLKGKELTEKEYRKKLKELQKKLKITSESSSNYKGISVSSSMKDLDDQYANVNQYNKMEKSLN